MKGAECAEKNSREKKKIIRFLFFWVENIENWRDSFAKNDTKMTITRKIKIVKI